MSEKDVQNSFEEDAITFLPTSHHVEDMTAAYDLGDKTNTKPPAYTDRIIWSFTDEKLTFTHKLYAAFCDVKASDHKPVILLGTIAKKN